MKVELRSEENKVEIGDAIVLNGNEGIRIIVKIKHHYGAYDPEDNKIYLSGSTSIDDILNSYGNEIERVIKASHLKIVEI